MIPPSPPTAPLHPPPPPSSPEEPSGPSQPPLLLPVQVHVPPEILNLVVGQAAADPNALATWCLVSLAMLEVAGPLLYEDVRLGPGNWETCLGGPDRVDPPFDSALCSEIALALSISRLRRLYLPPSVLPSITVASLAKLAARRPSTPAAVLSIVDPLSDGTGDLFTKGTAILLDVLQPATVVYNKLPFFPPVDASAMPIGMLDVLEGDSLEPFKLALASLPPPSSSPSSTSDETDTDIGEDVLVPQDRSNLYLQASTALDYLSCAHADVRLQADELLIRKIKTCLFHMTHAREFADDRVLGRAFEGDMKVCERAFERETLDVAIGVGADVRTFKAKRVDETLECQEILAWWMRRLGQPSLLEI